MLHFSTATEKFFSWHCLQFIKLIICAIYDGGWPTSSWWPLPSLSLAFRTNLMTTELKLATTAFRREVTSRSGGSSQVPRPSGRDAGERRREIVQSMGPASRSGNEIDL